MAHKVYQLPNPNTYIGAVFSIHYFKDGWGEECRAVWKLQTNQDGYKTWIPISDEVVNATP